MNRKNDRTGFGRRWPKSQNAKWREKKRPSPRCLTGPLDARLRPTCRDTHSTFFDFDFFLRCIRVFNCFFCRNFGCLSVGFGGVNFCLRGFSDRYKILYGDYIWKFYFLKNFLCRVLFEHMNIIRFEFIRINNLYL